MNEVYNTRRRIFKMKFSLKACLAVLSLAFFGAAIGMFALSFIDAQAVVLGNASKNTVASGFEIAFGQTNLESGNILGTLFAFIFVCVGVLAACYGCLFAFTQKKGKKGNKNAKLLCAVCTFAVCGVVPAVLLFLTLQTTGATGSVKLGGLLGANYSLGIGAILAAIFSVLGACSLSVAELSK